MVVKEGRFGPYVTDGETNASLRKGDTPEGLDDERAAELLAERRARGPAPKKARREGAPRKNAAKATRARLRPRRPPAKKAPPRRPDGAVRLRGDGRPGEHRLGGRVRPRGVRRPAGPAVTTFRRLYTALVLSSFGDWLGFLATTALAAQLVDGFQAQAYATGGVLVFRLLPAVIFGPLAGAFADRFDRRRTMVVCDFLRVRAVPVDPAVRLADLPVRRVVPHRVGVAVLDPGQGGDDPEPGPHGELEAANQLSLIAAYGSAPVAAVVFGAARRRAAAAPSFFSTSPVNLALYFDATTFLFSAFTVFRLEGDPASARDGHRTARGAAR